MPNWPSAGTVRDVPAERNLRILRKRGGELERELNTLKKEGLPPSGKAGGVLKGTYPNPEFAKEPAYKAELENETTARKEVDGILKGEIETEKAARVSADSTEKTERETADSLEKTKREEADNERVKGPASATENDIATYNGATGKIIKDSGKTIASVLLEAEETAKALASAAAAGLSIKNPVSYATTKALSPSFATAKELRGELPLEIDGAKVFPAGTRILLKNQFAKAQNGIWELVTEEAFGGTGTFGGSGKFGTNKPEEEWVLRRTADADTTEEVKQGMFVLITKGTTNTATSWLLTTADPIEIGATAQEFSAFTAAPTGVAGGDLEGNYPNPSFKAGAIVNADVNSKAGIVYSKLNLVESIRGTDLEELTVEDLRLASANNAAYKTLFFASQPFNTSPGAGTYLLAGLNPARASAANIAAYPVPVFYFDDADYTVGAKTEKMRLRAQVSSNATAPGITFTFGLYPYTVAGGASEVKFTLGTVVTGSTAAIASPSASTVTQANSGDFAIPADGAYVLAVATNASLAANSATILTATLQLRHV